MLIVLNSYSLFEDINLWDQGLSVQMEALKESQFYGQLNGCFPRCALVEGDQCEWITPKRFFCSLNSFSVEKLPVTKHKLAIPSAKWTYKQFEDFIEVVKLIVGNFRRSWIMNTIYECHSGWSVCCCCFVTVMSHVACGSTFIEQPSWYGLFPLFSPSKLSITFSLIDEIGLHLEEQLHNNLSFLPSQS